MKKIITTSLIAATFMFVGCGSSNQPTPKAPTYQCQMDGTTAPEWVCDGGATLKNGLYAVGSAPSNPLGISFQRQEAMGQARDALAREIKVKVNNMFKSYMSTTGIGDQQTAEKVATAVSKQLTSQVLQGSRLLKTWISPKHTMFVLVGMTGDIKQAVKQATKTTFKNDQALWQEFKAKQAQQALDTAIEKEFK